MKGIVAGIIAGIAGAAVWAIVAAVTGFEIGWIAWGIGAGVGAGVAWGSEGSPAMGVLAVVISVLAIVAGKFITVEMVLSREMGGAKAEIAQMLESEEYLISWMADIVIADIQESGGTVSWPAGVDPEEASTKAEYPKEIWARAEQSWSALTLEEKEEFKVDVQEQIEESMNMYAADVRNDGFLASFGVMDALFFLLAIGTAYKIGSKAD